MHQQVLVAKVVDVYALPFANVELIALYTLSNLGIASLHGSGH